MNKVKKYERIFFQLKELFKNTEYPIARLSTIAAVLHHKHKHFFWTGFYRLLEGKLTICCYQGSLACLVLEKDKGVCWKAVNERQTVIVPNVHKFQGHIACDQRSNSEIVIPIENRKGDVFCVLDIDSREFDAFDSVDQEWLEKITALI